MAALLLAAPACTKKRDPRGLTGGPVVHLQPVDGASAVVLRRLGRGKYALSLEDVKRGVRWSRAAYHGTSSTVGDGFVTVRYHEPGIESPAVRIGVVAHDLKSGRERWRFRAEERYDANLFAPSISTRAGGVLLERFEDRQDRTVIVGLDVKTGRKRWEHTLPGQSRSPRILGTTARFAVFAVDRSRTHVARFFVLRLRDGKAVWSRPIVRSALSGACLWKGRFWYLATTGLRVLDLLGRSAKDSLVNGHFFGPQMGGGPRRSLACGTYRGQLLLTLARQTKFMAPTTYVVAGLSTAGTVAWTVDLGRWEPKVERWRGGRVTDLPLHADLPRFVPFVAENTANPFGKRRLMVIDLEQRRVAATSPVRARLLNWTCRARLGPYFYFQRFEKNALFDGKTGRMVAAVHCAEGTWGVLRAAHGRVWLCGAKKPRGRWSLRDAATFAPVKGRYNFTGVTVIRKAPAKYFGLTERPPPRLKRP